MGKPSTWRHEIWPRAGYANAIIYSIQFAPFSPNSGFNRWKHRPWKTWVPFTGKYGGKAIKLLFKILNNGDYLCKGPWWTGFGKPGLNKLISALPTRTSLWSNGSVCPLRGDEPRYHWVSLSNGIRSSRSAGPIVLNEGVIVSFFSVTPMW